MLVVTKCGRSLGPSQPHGKELPLCSALASTLPIPLAPPPLTWRVWCHHHFPDTGKLNFFCPKHQVKTPRKFELPPAELPPIEGTRVCALPNCPQAEPGCPGHLWKWEDPCKGAERQLDWSAALPSEQDVPAHPASQRGASSLQTQEVTHITEITLSSRAARLPTLPMSQSALMRPDIYISPYPVPLTLKLIYKTGSQPSPPAQLTTPPRASVTSPPRQQS